MKRFRRIATLMLAIIMAASTAVIPSYAESDIQYSESDLHELIDYDMAVDAGHVNRLNDEEDLNTLIFANEDNTKTMYFYGEDIKYTDEFGVVRDKTNKLTSTATGYTNADNDISIHLPNTLSDGITIDYEDISLMLIPVVSELPDHIEADDIATSRGEADYVVYDDVFGAKTALKYTPMYSGLKEDIILEEYTGVSEFQFLLYTGGLELDEVDNEYVLLDGGEVVAQLSQVFIYDSEYNTAVGSMIVTPIKDDQIYAITVCADVDFLTASSTVYPVTVDPSITVNYSGTINGKSYIEDSIVSSTYPTINYGNATTVEVSSSNSLVLKFPGLSENQQAVLIQGSKVARFYVCYYCPSTTSNNSYSVRECSAQWIETSVTNQNLNINSTVKETGSITGSAGYKTISLSSVARAHVNLAELAYYGVKVSFNGNATLYTSEHSNTNYRPYLQINYDYYDINIYQIKQGSKYMCVNACEDDNGENIVLETSFVTDNDGNNYGGYETYFKLVSMSGSYVFAPLCSKNGRHRLLDIKKGSDSVISEGDNVQLYEPTSNYATQLFDIVLNADGQYSFLSHTDRDFAISSSSNNVEISTYNGSTSQKWTMVFAASMVAEETYYSNLNIIYPFGNNSSETRISSGYCGRYGKFHRGIDVDPYGNNVALVSPFDGEVVRAGFFKENDPDAEGLESRGVYIVIKADTVKSYNGGDLYVVYMHMSEVIGEIENVWVDTNNDDYDDNGTTISVEAGQFLGYTGNTGSSSGEHAHISFTTTSGSITYANSINPMSFYPTVAFTYSDN